MEAMERYYGNNEYIYYIYNSYNTSITSLSMNIIRCIKVVARTLEDTLL